MAIKETVPFNFDEIYSAVEAKFREKGYDIQEGSNTMQLVTAMSYLTSMLNVNTAVNINETLLPQATKRDMILRDARVLGYEIDHKRSYKYNLTLNFQNPGTYDIPKYAKFTAGDKTYYYVGNNISSFVVPNDPVTKYYSPDMPQFLDSNVSYEDDPGGVWNSEAGWREWTSNESDEAKVKVENLGYTFSSYSGVLKTLEVVEGTLYRYDDPLTSDQLTTLIDGDDIYYVDIPYTDVEEDGLNVFMTYVDDFGESRDREPWSKSSSFMVDKDTYLNKEYVRLDNIEFKTPRIYFKFGGAGRNLKNGTIINVNVLETSAEDGAIADGTQITTDLDCSILKHVLTFVGSGEESDESIKENAPLFHNTANRIVTKQDYLAFCNRQANIKTSVIWDGNDEQPQRPGHIWFSFLPSTTTRSIVSSDPTKNMLYEMQNTTATSNWFISDSVFQSVVADLDDYKIPTLQFHHRHPTYLDFNFDISVVKYVAGTPNEKQRDDIFNVVDEYFKDQFGVENFDFEYLNSNLIRRIDRQLTDNTGFDISLTTHAEFFPEHVITEDFDPCSVSTYSGRIAPFVEYKSFPNDVDFVGTEYKKQFGKGVAISGRRVFAGSIGNNHETFKNISSGANNGSPGIVYYLDWDSEELKYVFSGVLESSDSVDGDEFGSSLYAESDRLVVGAPRKNNSSGKIYVYDWNGSEYVEIQTIEESGSSLYGASVSIDGLRLFVGAPGENKVYVYRWFNNKYNYELVLNAPAEAEFGDLFGYSVCSNSGTLIVGAPGDNENGINSGKVYVFGWNGTAYSAVYTKISPRLPQSNAYFGSSVSRYGDKLFVGSVYDNTFGVDSGLLYYYNITGTTYSEIAVLAASDANANRGFGAAVMLNGDKLIVGSTVTDDNDNGDDDIGKFYVFNGTEVADSDDSANFSSLAYTQGEQSISADPNRAGCMAVNGTDILAIKHETENKIYVYRWNGSKYVEEQQIPVV